MPKETVIAHISTTRHLSPCGRGMENICCCVNVYIMTRDFDAFQEHFVAQWASPLKVYHCSYIRYSFILLMAVDSPGWKADWIESHRRVRYTHIQTHSGLWPVPLGDSYTESCWDVEWRLGLTWCKLKAMGCGKPRWETLCQLCSTLSAPGVCTG